ncbi:MAG: phosphopyruvate hydratase [bacterium]|nr:phosphopyruvate hydratase [bacterium]
MKITSIHGREILDSRGNPTVEVEVVLDDGNVGRASVPSGASTGSHEAVELRDGDIKIYEGKGERRAVANIEGEIAGATVGKAADDQSGIDEALIALDGTPNKSRLGANSILAVSLAVAHAAALGKRIPLYEHIRSLSETKPDILLPLPLCNVINGGKHAAGSTDIQEFMIAPVGLPTFRDAVRALTEVFHELGAIVAARGYATTVGDEGGYAPAVREGNAEALTLIAEAVEKAGYTLGTDFVFALDIAATELYRDGRYHLSRERKTLSAREMVVWYQDLQLMYPIVSIEDGLAEDDWAGWQALTASLGATTQLVGDDLITTNIARLERAIRERAGNAVLVKPNQIGTLTETIAVVDRAHRAGWHAIISHRSGETEDTTIAHLAVGLGTGQMKTGSVSRGERTAKYNELLRIEEQLGDAVRYAGGTAFTR